MTSVQQRTARVYRRSWARMLMSWEPCPWCHRVVLLHRSPFRLWRTHVLVKSKPPSVIQPIRCCWLVWMMATQRWQKPPPSPTSTSQCLPLRSPTASLYALEAVQQWPGNSDRIWSLSNLHCRSVRLAPLSVVRVELAGVVDHKIMWIDATRIAITTT